jgi:CheY-like chemotaxis protein
VAGRGTVFPQPCFKADTRLPLSNERTTPLWVLLCLCLSNPSVTSGFRLEGAYLATSSVRVLVVDDYEPFRRFFCTTLRKKADLQIIGEAADGLEAVQKAEELQPDIIVLDLGLPTPNGIEAARRIRKLSPKSKIIFVTLESSADVVQEGFSLGAGRLRD